MSILASEAQRQRTADALRLVSLTNRPFHERIIGINHELALEEVAGDADRSALALAHHKVIDQVHAAWTDQPLADVIEARLLSYLAQAFDTTENPAELARLITATVDLNTAGVTA